MSVASSMSESLDVPLHDPAFHAGDPFPAYARMRREAPVMWCEPAQVWAVSRYADICQVGREATRFTASRGSFMGQIPFAPATPVVSPLPEYTFATDPPQHGRYRRILGRGFTPRSIAQSEDAVRGIVRRTLDELPDGDPVEFVSAVAVPVTLNVIAAKLGVPYSDWADFRRWSDAAVDSHDTMLSEERRAQAGREVAELYSYLDDQLDQRQRTPQEDLMTEILLAAVDAERFTRSAQLDTVRGLLVAGNETTRNAASGGIVAFAQHPEQWQRLVADRSLSATATDEVLRYTSVLQHFVRAATEDTVLGGQHIAAGQFVCLLFASGNFDEEVFDEPARFDIGRPSTPPHIAFGFGAHRCIGAPLARLEIRVLLEELASRYRGWNLVGDVVRTPSTVTTRYERVPVLFQRW